MGMPGKSKPPLSAALALLVLLLGVGDARSIRAAPLKLLAESIRILHRVQKDVRQLILVGPC